MCIIFRNKEKHTDTKFCNFDDAKKLVNDPRFNSIDELGDVFEVNFKNSRTLSSYVKVFLSWYMVSVKNLNPPPIGPI